MWFEKNHYSNATESNWVSVLYDHKNQITIC